MLFGRQGAIRQAGCAAVEAEPAHDHFECAHKTKLHQRPGNDIGGYDASTGNSIAFGNNLAIEVAYPAAQLTTTPEKWGGITVTNSINVNVGYNTVTSAITYITNGNNGITLGWTGGTPAGFDFINIVNGNIIVLNSSTVLAASTSYGIDLGYGLNRVRVVFRIDREKDGTSKVRAVLGFRQLLRVQKVQKRRERTAVDRLSGCVASGIPAMAAEYLRVDISSRPLMEILHPAAPCVFQREPSEHKSFPRLRLIRRYRRPLHTFLEYPGGMLYFELERTGKVLDSEIRCSASARREELHAPLERIEKCLQ